MSLVNAAALFGCAQTREIGRPRWAITWGSFSARSGLHRTVRPEG